MVRLLVSVAVAVSFVLGAFALRPETWPLAIVHLGVGAVILLAYLRPMSSEVEAEIARRASR